MSCNFYSDIDYADIFNQTVKLRMCINSDSEYTSEEYTDEEIDINVRISGGGKLLRNENDQELLYDKVYKTLYPVKIKDLINGQVVVYVKTVYDFDGTLAMYKAFV